MNYNRIMLSPVLSGEKAFEEIVIHDDGWYDRRTASRSTRGDRSSRSTAPAKTVTVAARHDGGLRQAAHRHRLGPFIIPVPGHDLPGVVTFRDLDDVDAMLAAAAQSAGKAVVIGGGLLGLEAAAGLRPRGMDVTVLHLMPTLMERQLDPAAGYLLQKALEERGIKVTAPGQHQGDPRRDARSSGVELEDGTRAFRPTLVVMAVGIRPNAALAKDAGLAVNRGIVVDDHMRTSDPAIFALGECVEHRGHGLRPRRAALGDGQRRGRASSPATTTAAFVPARSRRPS